MAETKGRSCGGNAGNVRGKDHFATGGARPFAKYGMVKDPAAQRIRPTPTPTKARPGNRPTPKPSPPGSAVRDEAVGFLGHFQE
ncbi:hypothetical protein AGR4C_Cc80458 [Agrobacterium tumefaciens str. Kerr 14]|uniref:Uncharacterized protein n=1 Tax=Agrobacterium tumefaciens str. Kerr 14 TaxID=1183424 RepID=A0A1S7QSB9_AGRTU|nr:hypothetical protein AGR4C_Cc80458 [Agrobacterium tumefaciens str. Kerr 14]